MPGLVVAGAALPRPVVLGQAVFPAHGSMATRLMTPAATPGPGPGQCTMGSQRTGVPGRGGGRLGTRREGTFLLSNLTFHKTLDNFA